jgi:lipoate-protein ligase A
MDSDRCLLERCGEGIAPPTIRCYNWNAPAVTIGRLQSEERASRQFLDLPLYRRPTGGKAVLHGDDLTVVVAARYEQMETDCDNRRVRWVYNLLTSPLMAALRSFGVSSERGAQAVRGSSGTSNEDCFGSAAQCDVLDAKRGIKIVGSAMRCDRSAALLQVSVRPLTEVDIMSEVFEDRLRTFYMKDYHVGCCIVSDR